MFNRSLRLYFFMSRLGLVGFLVVLVTQAYSGERFEFYNGVRSLGMGGVTVAVVNDETALITNPAALGKLRDYFLTMADPELDLGADTIEMIGLDVLAFLDPQETLDKANEFPGQRFHQRAQVFPSFVVKNFGIGFYGKYAVDAFTDNPATVYTYNYRNDFAAILGFNFRLFDGRLKVGFNGRAINRVEAHRTDIPVGQTGLDLETVVNGTTIASEGFGVAGDVGVILTGPWTFLPSIAAVYRDVGKTSYNMNEGIFIDTTNRPDRTPETIDVGFSLTPIIGKGNRMTIAGELVDVLDAVEPEDEEASDEITRRIHYGIEFNFKDVFFIRAGANQGYWTAGLEVAMFNSQFQIATYGEEVGDVVPVGSAASYTKIEDRRYVAKYSYRF